MEFSGISDMKLVQPVKSKIPKQYMPYKQIGFFEDKLLTKNIGSLKINLDKRENFLNIYNSPLTMRQKSKLINGNLDNIEINQTLDVLANKQNVKAQHGESSIISNINDITHEKTKPKSFRDDIKFSTEKSKTGALKRTFNSTEKKVNPLATTNFSNFSKGNLILDYTPHKTKVILEKIDNKKIITTKKNNENKENTILPKNKASISTNTNILKNQIISGHLNKDLQTDLKNSEISSVRNTLYSNFNNFSQFKNDDPENKSVMTKKGLNDSNFNNRNASVDCVNDSFKMNTNFKFDSKLNVKNKQNMNNELPNTKNDFIYKKIFDKKSRILIEKANTDLEIKRKQKSKSEKNNSDYLKNMGFFKKRQYIEDKIEDIKRKIFFIKGVYDFSYPKIIVNKVKTAQDLYNKNHTDQKLKLRESMNNTSKKIIENYEEKLRKTTEKFKTTMFVENHNKSVELEKNENNYYYPESEKKLIKSTTSLNFKSLKNMKLTLTQKYANPEDIKPFKVLNPINIKIIYPDLGEPSKLKMIHKPKIL